MIFADLYRVVFPFSYYTKLAQQSESTSKQNLRFQHIKQSGIYLKRYLHLFQAINNNNFGSHICMTSHLNHRGKSKYIQHGLNEGTTLWLSITKINLAALSRINFHNFLESITHIIHHLIQSGCIKPSRGISQQI